MLIDIALFLMGLIGILIIGFVFGIMIKFLAKSVFSIITFFILAIAGIAVCLFAVLSFRSSITSDYRCVDTLDTYKIYNISFEDDKTVVHYIDNNKEIKHIKSENVKIFYDLNDDHEPYAVRNQYWRWFIYWEEIEVHIKE